MNLDERKILDFLLSADFDAKKGYSYNDLISFLKAYKQYYASIYTRNEQLKGELGRKDKTIRDYDSKIEEIEKKMERLKSENEVLTKMISRKLTMKERFLGKFKWKNK